MKIKLRKNPSAPPRSTERARGPLSTFTPLEATNTGLSFNRGSGGGAPGGGVRGCGFEERAVAYARTEGGHFL